MAPLCFLLAVIAHLAVCARASRLAGRLRVTWALAPALFVSSLLASQGIIAQKAIAVLLMPVGLMWIALLIVASLALVGWSREPSRSRRRWAIAACGGLSAFWLASITPVSAWVALRWERDFESTVFPAEPLDAAFLLGGATTRTPSGRAELAPAGDRLATAALLANRGLAARIVCTGSDFLPADPRALTDDTRVLLEGMGVPASKLVVLSGARNTSQEMAAAAELIRREGWRRVGVVTSAWHMRRALRLARRNGIDPLPIAADHRGSPPTIRSLLDVIPSPASMWTLQLVAWELLGSAVGR
jgi:uncharacterized SAM-binding protein YcdF (DUF218 family)